MSDYYFLINSLPPLKLGVKPEMSYEEVEELVQQNVSPSDREKVVTLRQYIDLKNLRLLWMDLPIDPRGNLNRKQLEADLLIQGFFPSFVYEFLQTYDDLSDRLNHFLSLIAKFLKHQSMQKKGFLSEFFRMEREVKLISTALRAKDAKRDLSYELQYEDPKDFLVKELLAEKESMQFEPPEEYKQLKVYYEMYREDYKALFFAISDYCFRKIGEIERGDFFSIDTVLTYMARLILVEDWEYLDEEKGKAIVTSLL